MENGLPHNEFNRFSFPKNNRGRYYFGNMNGVTSFKPRDPLNYDDRITIQLSKVIHYAGNSNEKVTQHFNFEA